VSCDECLIIARPANHTDVTKPSVQAEGSVRKQDTVNSGYRGAHCQVVALIINSQGLYRRSITISQRFTRLDPMSEGELTTKDHVDWETSDKRHTILSRRLKPNHPITSF